MSLFIGTQLGPFFLCWVGRSKVEQRLSNKFITVGQDPRKEEESSNGNIYDICKVWPTRPLFLNSATLEGFQHENDRV